MNKHHQPHILFGAVLILTLSACSNGNGDADAYGNFEAVETLVSAKGAGELISFNLEEGMELEAGQQVGVIDTTLLSLQAEQVAANREAIASQARNLVAQVAVQDARVADLQREEARLVELVAGKAATQKQLDDMRGQITIQKKQVAALESQNPGIVSQVRAMNAQEAIIHRQIRDMRIVNPATGTVVSKLVEPHELTAPGKGLYRIAQMDTLELRAYVSGSQLVNVKVGAAVEVGIDNGENGLVRLPGRVSWISSETEFTPKTIQTREERVDMVYAFKVRVPNSDGALKSGMPGEVYFNSPAK